MPHVWVIEAHFKVEKGWKPFMTFISYKVLKRMEKTLKRTIADPSEIRIVKYERRQ